MDKIKTQEDLIEAFRKHVPDHIANMPDGPERKKAVEEYFPTWWKSLDEVDPGLKAAINEGS